jgi:Methyltransferase FkbM domain
LGDRGPARSPVSNPRRGEDWKIGEIDFLKINAEGAEAAVLDGLDISRRRPAVILVEATLPMTKIPSHEGWESGLLACGYGFCWVGGLNRFYLAQKRPYLDRHFKTPPSVHDTMPRFGGFGSAIRNPEHPDHGFARHLASRLLRAPGIETDAYLEQIMRTDRPPALFDKPVDAAAVTELYLLVLAHRPEPAALEKLLAGKVLTGAELLHQLLRSHEFRTRRSRIALS